MSKRIKLDSLTPDDKNFNKHTQRGMGLLDASISKVGVIESITVSSDDKIISGNARHEVMGQKFDGVDPIVVETDGTRPVILKRTDIIGNSKQFYEAALLANTVSKHNISLDYDKIQEVAIDEFNINVEELGVNMPESEAEDDEDNGPKEYYPTFKFIVSCKTKKEMNKLMAEILGRGFTCETE